MSFVTAKRWNIHFYSILKSKGETWSTVCVILAIRSSMMKVVLSEHNLEIPEGFEQVHNVSKIFLRGFKSDTFDNDIMLIKVGMRAATWNNRWRYMEPCTVIYLFVYGRKMLLFFVCVPAEQAGDAQRQRPASCSAWLQHSSTFVWHLHSERLGRDTGLQSLPVPCATCCGRENTSVLQILLLLDDHLKHAVCRISAGWQRLLPGTDYYYSF